MKTKILIFAILCIICIAIVYQARDDSGSEAAFQTISTKVCEIYSNETVKNM